MLLESVTTPKLNFDQQKIINVIEASSSAITKWQSEKTITIFLFLTIIILLVFWMMALINILFRNFKNPTDKIVWLLAIIFIFPIAPLYFVWLKKQKK